ncbi:hypothetical protein ACIA8H_33920 [Streptomyces goshikiensis]|uniref:hypothetical protein n=1 Tax=Streptomyces goshikiensis TaxID=1942 RepID=UPI00379774AC
MAALPLPAHGDKALLADMEADIYDPDKFIPISLDVPNLLVDTSDGYTPGMAEIQRFVVRQDPEGDAGRGRPDRLWFLPMRGRSPSV